MKKVLSGFIMFSILITISACGNKPVLNETPFSVREPDSRAGNEAVIGTREVDLVEFSGTTTATTTDAVFPRHEPYGTGIGAQPERVVWAYNPQSVDWDGNGYWWELNHFNEAVIQQMVDDGITKLAGESEIQAGWDSLFKAQNTANGVAGGYRSGQKIAIKTNMNGAGAYGDDTKGETQESYTNPVLLKSLLVSLVTRAGVAPGDSCEEHSCFFFAVLI